MNDTLSRVAAFLIDAERLKLVERSAYVSNRSRRENSAEHSWHLALAASSGSNTKLRKTRESRWIKVLDRVMPFIVNLACEGRNWMDQSISRSQVLKINAPVQRHAPEIFEWMVERAHECVRKGWLKDA